MLKTYIEELSYRFKQWKNRMQIKDEKIDAL